MLSACCVLAAMTFAVHAQPLTFTTFAGPAGGPGSADGTGSAARFSAPYGVATDSNGNIYVADRFNSTIRKITPAGVVTTLAGMSGVDGSADGRGSVARFDGPRAVATDSGGNVVVADTFNNTIRKITPAGVVTTLAGSPGVNGIADGIGSTARFSGPQGVATDNGGNVYVADTLNDTIRKITPAGVVTTLAGSATAPSGSEDGTGSAARFDDPIGVATDGAGNVYVADNDNYTIRKITPLGVVTTLAGSAGLYGDADGTGSAARFDSPTGVATDSSGNVYVADGENLTIRKITPTGVVTTVAGSPRFYGSEDGTGSAARFGDRFGDGPKGVATDREDNVYVADTDNNTIRKITPAGVVTTLAGSAQLFGSADGTGNAARFINPRGVATDGAGNVFVCDTADRTIRKITPAGVVSTFAGSPGYPFVGGSADGTGSAARFSYPTRLAIDAAGTIYVADTVDDTIRKITPAGVVTTLAGSAADPSGSEDGTGSAARFDHPQGVATDSGGNVYVADTLNDTIRKITPAGAVTTLAGLASFDGSVDGTGIAARFNHPTGLATDSVGNIYVADTNNHTIRKITSAAVVTTLAGAPGLAGSDDGTGGAARFDSPTGVATDRDGNVYVADSDNFTIRKITPAGVVTTVAGSPGLFGSADGTGSGARFGWDLFGGGPQGVATDNSGNVFVADTFNNSIRIGRPLLADVATIDFSSGSVGTMRQLSTTPQTATSWQWRIIRTPSGSSNALSSVSIRNPLFTPDVADLYIFQLTASDGVKTSITNVELTATPAQPGPRHRAVRH